MEPDDTRKGKKKPAKAGGPNKARAAKRGARKGAKVAVAAHDEPEPDAVVVIADPWLRLKSPLGGRLSPAEEWKRLQDAGSYGRGLTLTTGARAKAVVEASTPEKFRLATTTVALKHEVLCREEEAGGEEINAGGVAAAAPTAPNGDDDWRDDDDGDADDDDRPVERLVVRGEDSAAALVNKTNSGGNASIGSRCAWRLLTTALVKIDLVGTRLGDEGLETVVAAFTPWLRELSAPGNSLTRIPSLQALGKLQILDLSKNNIGTIAPEAFPSELGPTLRSLNLEGNRLDSLLVTAAPSEAACSEHHQGHQHTAASSSTPWCALRVLTSLVELNLSSNRFESSVDSLAVVTRAAFPRLISLDFRDNRLPHDQETSEVQRIPKGLPTLKTLNGEEVSRQAMTMPSSKGPLFELLSIGDQCVNEGRREESCSCIEGNVCAVAYLCRDWPNRFEVAAAATAATADAAAGSQEIGQKH